MVAEMITKIGIPSDAELFLRVIVASVLGYMIGYERKNRDKSAGMRTHAIVALGAALMMVVSKYGFYDVENILYEYAGGQSLSPVCYSRSVPSCFHLLGFLFQTLTQRIGQRLQFLHPVRKAGFADSRVKAGTECCQ